MAQKTKFHYEETTPRDKPARRLSMRAVAILAVGGLLLIGGGFVFADWWVVVPEGTTAKYVGRQSCVQCHTKQAQDWTGSHHDRAMDLATPETVLGDFNNAELTHFGITSRLFRKDGKFMAHTEGPDGEMQDFEIKYVFGVDPLQQYMVEFDRPAEMPDSEIARLQVLRISWDTHRKQWFYLSPPDVDERLAPTDDLHWTGVAQRWNNMCADCHSTNLQKNFDVESKTYHTTFSEIDVSCEACHGPGSVHVELAQKKRLFWDRKRGYGLAKLKQESSEAQIQACAPCHSRRRIVHPDFRPGENYYDYFANELPSALTYFADGQIMDEVYEHGSFIQSKMYHKNIRCSDCHDPHSTKLIHQGNQVCTSCHQHPAGKYDGPAHHRHNPDGTGASCVECHMPQTTYMDVDPRRDHSLRVPRPDLSVKLGTPNACTRCHLDINKISEEKRPKLKQYKDWILAARGGDEEIKQELNRLDVWARDFVVQWYGDKHSGESNFAEAISASWDGKPEAVEPLSKLLRDRQLPAIVRAMAANELMRYGTRESLPISIEACRRALSDPDPLVRAAAVARFEPVVPTVGNRRLSDEELGHVISLTRPLIKELAPLLEDPVRLVRTEAGRVLARVPPQVLPHVTTGPQRNVMNAAIEEFKAGLMVNNDRAASHLMLGILYENLGDDIRAEQAYRTAIHVEPGVTGPRTNLAAMYDRMAEAAQQQGQQAVTQRDRASVDRHAEVVVRHRLAAMDLRKEEMKLLKRDALLVPNNADVQYRYAMSAYLNGDEAEAEKSLLRALELEPNTSEFVLMLALLYQKQQRWPESLSYAKRLIELQPNDPSYQKLLQDIRQRRGPEPTIGPSIAP
jgi:tetratricopeptide (TPR) repeat protein